MPGHPTMTAHRAVLFVCFLLALTGCRHGRCFRDTDCSKELICLDPDFKPAPPAKRCGEGEVRCVAGCQARCTPDSCDSNKVCGEAGCCEPRPCNLNNDCGHEDSCVDNLCRPPGNCTEPPADKE